MRHLIAVILIAISSVAHAVTHTVATRAQLDTALANINDGDIIHITCGIYTNWGTITVLHTSDGAANNRITITSNGDDCAIFSGNNALKIDMRAAFWTIKNLKFQNITTFGPFLSTGAAGGSVITLDGAQNVIIDNVDFANISGPGVPIAIMRLNGVRATTGNIIQNMDATTGYAQNNGDAAFIYLYQVASRGFNEGLTIRDSRFGSRTATSQSRKNYWIRIGDCCANFYDSNVLIQRVTIENDTVAVPQQDTIYIEASGVDIVDSTFRRTSSIEARRGNGHNISRNKIIDPISTLTDYWLKIYGSGHTVSNNLCYTVLGSKTCFDFGMGNTDVNLDGRADYDVFKDSMVAHNSIDGFAKSSVVMNIASSGNNDGVTTILPNGIRFINNAIRQTTGTMVIGGNCATQFSEIANNGWSGAALPGCLTQGTNNTIAPPQWTNAAGGDYTLLPSSPYINASTQIECVLQTEVDHAGRVRDASPDIGAFEYSQATPVIPPATSCNEQFGSAPNYLACWEDDLTCAFNALTNMASCTDMCASFGKVCVTSYGNETNSCAPLAEELCTVNRSDQICVCKRNDEPAESTGDNNFYVDTSCSATPGNGTTETCGVNGPWPSLEYAVEIADCAGMVPGDILHIKGSTTPQSDGTWYAGEFDQPDTVGPDSSCSGIILQNASGHHTTMDGTVDLSGQAWTEIGTSNVFRCDGALCGTLASYPFTAWYQIGAGVEQRLNLVQSTQACDGTLVAGHMRVDPISNRVCAHLSDDSSPADATYFRIPYYESALKFDIEDTDHMVIRQNPDKSGSLTLTRYRDDLITINPSVSQGIVIENLNLSWAKNRAIAIEGTAAAASTRIVGNDISFVGGVGIDWSGDLGQGSILRNTIHDIGTWPVFEECEGIGSGCLGSSPNYAVGILVNNCRPDDGGSGGTIQSNAISAIGGSSTGYGVGIELKDCTYRNLIDGNHIYNSHVQNQGAHGILVSGIPLNQYHDENIISNTRCENMDACFTWDTDTVTSQAGKVNHFVGATCHNPNYGGTCYQQLDGAAIGGSLFFRNNIASIENGYTKLVNIPVSAHWAAGFENNAFECPHDDCADEDIITLQGVNYERFENCTPLVDCPADIGDGNLYGPMRLECQTLEIGEGSFAINQGQNLGELPLDYLFHPRPFGAFSDIGAHEAQFEFETANLTQYSYKVYNTFLPEGEGLLAAESVTPEVHKRARFTLRFALGGNDTETAQYIAHLVPYYQHCNPTCGNWTPLPTDCDGNPICLVDHPTRSMDSSISNQLALNGRAFSANSRFVDLSSSSIPLIFVSTHQVEIEMSLGFGSTIDTGDTLALRMQYTNGDEISLYEQTPTFTIVPAKFRKEFN